MKRMTKDSWTPEQDEVLANLATQTWASRKALLEEIGAQIPNIDPVKALYHAVKHNKADYQYVPTKLSGEALTDATDMLREDLDSTAVQKQIQLSYGIYLSTTYYNKLRFKIRRGEYTVVEDPKNSGQCIFEHRLKMRQNIQTVTPNVTTAKVTVDMKGKYVTHPDQMNVANNDYTDLYLCDPKDAYKIKQINFVAKVLGLDFGQLMGHITEDVLSRYTPQKILSDLFDESGLSSQAFKLFDTAEATLTVVPPNEA